TQKPVGADSDGIEFLSIERHAETDWNRSGSFVTAIQASDGEPRGRNIGPVERRPARLVAVDEGVAKSVGSPPTVEDRFPQPPIRGALRQGQSPDRRSGCRDGLFRRGDSPIESSWPRVLDSERACGALSAEKSRREGPGRRGQNRRRERARGSQIAD